VDPVKSLVKSLFAVNPMQQQVTTGATQPKNRVSSTKLQRKQQHHRRMASILSEVCGFQVKTMQTLCPTQHSPWRLPSLLCLCINTVDHMHFMFQFINPLGWVGLTGHLVFAHPSVPDEQTLCPCVPDSHDSCVVAQRGTCHSKTALYAAVAALYLRFHIHLGFSHLMQVGVQEQ
jgi:hypothetical protein